MTLGSKNTMIERLPLNTPNRMPLAPGRDHVRIQFPLDQDADGYPPATSETLWAVPIGRSRFVIDNIPFFVYGISCYDVVSAFPRCDAHNLFKYDQLIEPRGHSTLRVIFYENTADARSIEDRVTDLRSRLHALGCGSERSHISGLISVDVPPSVQLVAPKRILDLGKEQGFWGYEEATLAHES